METNKKFIPVMLMPFLEDGDIDYKSLNQLVEFYLSAGAKGLFANCLSSEMYHLSKQEMLDTVSFIVKIVDNRVPVVATGTFEDSIDNQASFIRDIYETGVKSVIVITSLLANEDDSEEVFRKNVLALLKNTENIPLGFYECPIPYKRIIDAGFLGELVKDGRVKYHKDTSLCIKSVSAKLLACQSNSDFGLYDAYIVNAVESLMIGASGLSCIQGNYFPELIVWICQNYNNQELQKEVTLVQAFFNNNMDLMHKTYPSSAKYILRKRSLAINEYCRNRHIVLNEMERLELDELYAEFEILIDKLGLDFRRDYVS